LRWLLGALSVLPAALLLFLLADPGRNASLDSPVEHLAVVSNVAVLALAAALLIARTASQMGRYGIVLTALGFMSMAWTFLVHGLATPGVILGFDKKADVIVGASAYLSLLVPAGFFAVRYTGLAGWMSRQPLLGVRRLPLLVAGALASYAAIALIAPDRVAALFLLVAPPDAISGGYGGTYAADLGILPYVGAVVIALLLFAAYGQAREALASRMPMHFALVGAYLLLGQAQVAMVLAPIWTLGWWEYHVLMLAATVTAVAALFLELDRRRGLERFLPSTVVERVIQGDRLRLAGDRVTATILFADLRGSTTLAERLAPEAVVEVLNEYLGVLARAVFAHGGVLDKFTGDGLMAIFGIFPDGSAGAVAAVRAARDMVRDVAELDRRRAERGVASVGFGVGINTGEVVVGALGIPERADYTAIGDTVNTAARLESLSKELEVRVVFSREVADRLGGEVAVRPLGSAAVKGRAEEVSVFTLA